MTIPGVDATVALSIVAAVGDFRRFGRPSSWCSYLGLNPRVRQSGSQPASHGRITKQGRAHARGMLVEAAWVAVQDPGPAARVLSARPRAARDADRRRRDRPQAGVLCWHLIIKRRGLRLRAPVADRQEAAGARAARRDAGPARARRAQPPATRSKRSAARELELAEQAEHAYRQLVADWQAKAPAKQSRAWPPPTGRD